jgi:deoxyxylulose-5-phosphate synthase
VDHFIDASAGSLGHGRGIAIGMALSEPDKQVFCLMSDGEVTEGSVYEGFSFLARRPLDNLKLFINFNGYGAYSETNIDSLELLSKLSPVRIINTLSQYELITEVCPNLQGQAGHYHVLDQNEYEDLLGAFA